MQRKGNRKGQPKRNFKTIEALMAKVRKEEKENGCWIWTGYTRPDGYGMLFVDGGMMLARRFAYEVVKGVIPEGKGLWSTCKNVACVNPDHLFAATFREVRSLNLVEFKAAKVHRGRLTDPAVRDIRSYRLKPQEFADLYGVSKGTIFAIQARRMKRAVPD